MIWISYIWINSHWFALFEAMFYFAYKDKVLHILKAFRKSSHIAPFPKQNNISIEQLYSLKGHIAEGGAILALQQENILLTRLLHQWNLQ